MLLSVTLHRRVVIGAILLLCVSATLYASYFRRGESIRHTIWQSKFPPPTPSAIPPTSSTSTSTGAIISNDGDSTYSQVGIALVNQRDWWNSHNFTYPLRYSSREIITKVVRDLRRASNTIVELSLFDQFYSLESGEIAADGLILHPKPLAVEVPPHNIGPILASHLIFGIQTTIGRLEDSIGQLSRWLPRTGAKLCVVLLEREKVPVNMDQMLKLESHMKNLGFEVTLFPAKKEDTFPQRYFSLVNIMYKHRTPDTKWISLIDDDTFFPSMPALLNMLAKYDHQEQYYIGSLSEDWWAVSHYGFMGFGGAGLFLSLPLAEVMDANTEDCKNGLRSSAGDITIMDCIYRYTPTKLTPVPELHQMDIQGDVSGLFESGRKHISLHHWKAGSVSGKGFPIPTMHLVADVCGECFLQRWQFGDEMVLTNGFSITTYPKGHLNKSHEEAIDLGKVEETWNNNMNTRNSLGPVRRRLELNVEKIQYSFLDGLTADGVVRQTYFHKGEGEPDTVLELFWTRQKNGD